MLEKEKVNVGRQKEFDIAKGLAILFMILVHCMLIAMLFNSSVSPLFSHAVNDILGGPTAAPVFMFCMGIGIVYSRRSTWDIMIKRGINLMLVGLIVNIGEFILPHFISGSLLGDSSMFPIYGGLILFYVDILAFAGLSFILIGIFKKLNLNYKHMLAIAIVMSLIGSYVRSIDFNNDILNVFFAYFIGTTEAFSAMPLLNWFIYPVAGYVYGEYFIRAPDKSRFFRFWPLFLLFGLAYFILTIYFPGEYLFSDETYYFFTTIDAFITIIYIHGIIGLCYELSKIIPDIVTEFFTLLSKYINGIYVAQWYLIPITFILICYFNKGVVFNDLSITIISVFILVASILLSIANKKIRTRNKNA